MTDLSLPRHEPSSSIDGSTASTDKNLVTRSAANNQADFAALAAALSSQRPIAYSVNLARITGDVKAALFLSQLIYWTRVGTEIEHHEGWVFKSREDWTHETGLSRYEQESARAKLVELGLAEESRVGTPARNCYRVVPQVLGTMLARLLRSEPVQWTLFDIRSNAQQFKALLGRNLAFYKVFTEITPSVASAVYLTKALAVQRNVVNAQSEGETKQTSKSNCDSDWFCLTPSQWIDETGLTISQQRESKQKLCQLNYLEEAFQTYPKRRTFIRVSMNEVSIAIRDQVFKGLVAGDSQHGILGILAKGMQQRAKLNAREYRQIFPMFPQAKHRQILPTVPQANHRQILPIENSAATTNCRSVNKFNTATVCRSDLRGHHNFKVEAIVQKTSCENPPSSSVDFLTLDGDFSQVSRGLLAGQLDGFSSSSRGLLAGLHARTRFLTTDKTTTTTTDYLATENLNHHPDGDFSQPVVVVVNSDDGLVNEKAFHDQHQNKHQSQHEIFSSLGLSHAGTIIWPTQLSHEEQLICLQLLQKSTVHQNRYQVLVDELTGNLWQSGKVKNALTYFAALIKREQSTVGGIVALVAHQVQAQRKARLANEERIAATFAAAGKNIDTFHAGTTTNNALASGVSVDKKTLPNGKLERSPQAIEALNYLKSKGILRANRSDSPADVVPISSTSTNPISSTSTNISQPKKGK
jgi:hypothetical protein